MTKLKGASPIIIRITIRLMTPWTRVFTHLYSLVQSVKGCSLKIIVTDWLIKIWSSYQGDGFAHLGSKTSVAKSVYYIVIDIFHH